MLSRAPCALAGRDDAGENAMHASLKIALLLLAVALAACAPVGYRPIVDPGARIGDYDADVAQCQDVADHVRPADHAVAGAVVGAIFGALLGRAVGLNGHDTTQVAAIGAINGAENGLAYGSAEWYDVVNRCMARRGYEILP